MSEPTGDARDGEGAERPARVIGVIGAGTMGAGIAQLACQSGAITILHDPVEEAMQRGRGRIEQALERLVARGRLEAGAAESARGRLHTAPTLEAMAEAELVIEAAPERLELKHELFGALSQIVSERCVLATNTSSLPVTGVATGASHPERVVGMHFFNPAPVMRLVEVIAGEASSPHALALTRATAEAMGKLAIDARDGPGFLVNRCNRPFGSEALRLLAERVADAPTIDRAVRLGGGFRMGPFELSDLVGVDVGLEVTRSFYALSFGEPRWRPSPIAQRMVDARYLGRKSGRGYYDYSGPEHRPEDPPDPEFGGGEGTVVVEGDNPLAAELRALAGAAGWEVLRGDEAGDSEPVLAIDCGATEEELAPPHVPRLLLLDAGPLSALDPGGASAGFFALAPLEAARAVEMTSQPSTAPAAVEAGERFFATLGKRVVPVGDAPGLVLGRIVCQLVNEAAFALGEGVGSARDIDLGMVHGLNHPRGPLEWADAIGLDIVLTVLDALWEEYREERYRAAPLLRRRVREGRLGRHVGGGFHPAPRVD